MPQHETVDGIFRVKSIDAEGKKFGNVSRIVCDSESLKLNVCLDVNTQIFPGSKMTLFKAGKVYRTECENDSSGGQMSELSLYVSFGGLLMRMRGKPYALDSFCVDQNVYLMMKRL